MTGVFKEIKKMQVSRSEWYNGSKEKMISHREKVSDYQNAVRKLNKCETYFYSKMQEKY